MFARRKVRKFANEMAMWCLDRARENIEAANFHASKGLAFDQERVSASAYNAAAAELLRRRP